MLPAGHSHSDATMGSAAATASTRMTCKGRLLRWLARLMATMCDMAGAMVSMVPK